MGAARHCDLKPKGWVKERVTVWEAGRSVGLEVAESEWPIVFMRWRTDLSADGRGTHVVQDLEYQVSSACSVGCSTVSSCGGSWNRGIADVFAGLKRHVEARAASDRAAPAQVPA